MYRLDHPLTKRQLGALMLLGGVLGAVGVFVVDLLPGREGIIGPAQVVALAGCVVIALIGATLLPLGDKPA